MWKIRDIEVHGNKKTKTYIILREMQLKTGDTIGSMRLLDQISISRSLVYNLNLFSEVKIDPVFEDSAQLRLVVTVRERWYLYPTPQFQLVDRNFNEWVKVYNSDFNRVVYGAKLVHYNFSGRGDQLKIFALNGYLRNFSFSYSTPYSNPGLTEGYRVSAGFTQNREISYKTTYSNKLLQFKKDGFVRNSFGAGIGYSRRRGFFRKTSYALSYNYVDVNDSIISSRYNPYYFNSSKSYQSFFDLSVGYQYVKADNINYPLDALAYGLALQKRGFQWSGGINMLSADASLSYFKPLVKDFSLYHAVQLYGRLKLPFDQPYFNLRNLGYGDLYLRGLEYYVVDGVAAMLGKYTIRKKLLSFKINIPFNIRQFPYIPFTFYGKTFADAGFSYIKPQFESRLNNRLLYTYGFGVDVLSLYDINLNVEYGFNQLGENGLFLHVRGGF